MGFFQTKDPKTGEPRLGAGVYLIICALMIGGTILWNVRQNANDPSFISGGSRTSAAPTNPTEITPVAEAAQQHSETIKDDGTPGVASDTRSIRDVPIGTGPSIDPTDNIPPPEVDPVDTVQNTFDILRQNQERAEREKAEAVAKAKAEAEARIEELKRKAMVTATVQATESQTPPTPTSGQPGTVVSEDNTVEVNSQALTIFDAKRDIPASASQLAPTRQPTGFETKRFLPRGFFFPVYTLSTIQTLGQEDIIILGVAENVIFQNRVQIPFGTRLLGSAAASNFEDRVAVNIDTILYPDGRELPISALAKDATDLSAGIKGYYIPQPAFVQLTPYANEFLALYTEAVTDRLAGRNRITVDENGNNIEERYNVVAGLIRDQANKIQARLDRRYPEKVVVPIGTKAYVQLRTPLDLTNASIAGSLENTQPILPGFENNPITPSGQVERTANPNAEGRTSITSLTPTNTPRAAPAPVPVAPTPQRSNPDAAQAQEYMNALQQLEAFERQLQRSSSGTRSSSTPRSNTQFPAGDIQ